MKSCEWNNDKVRTKDFIIIVIYIVKIFMTTAAAAVAGAGVVCDINGK